jgi:hypothetical protein
MNGSRILSIVVSLSLTAFAALAIAATDSEIEAAVAQSDDYSTHKSAFIAAARSLVESQQCTTAELKDIGGFAKSPSYKNRPIYVTYCGGMMAIENRIMLDASTGRIFR